MPAVQLVNRNSGISGLVAEAWSGHPGSERKQIEAPILVYKDIITCWIKLQDTLMAANNMISVFVSEQLDPDPILWSYVQTVIPLLENATAKDILRLNLSSNYDNLLRQTRELLLSAYPGTRYLVGLNQENS
ncbi:hypothetical protein TSTA_022390 [Talaromyces stipitatus ATCC 10500]|uniref:Uncharacterized protein n=1 Tax=Talaromyces stipitatus (strain ATCC 10500 / CBS 375.48 / QM 6759 / NRRL 1006) TaxID=441959 RepID=B8MI23_TALSN|nr:uncharacterized protein TSTA_022390 [Talaromyces stipitatus ATCC 10500]EED17185.1 hypothetical protein TSTA_022390 [Talaromyces stipitatus ATCC 10500]